MSTTLTVADQLRQIPMGIIWRITFVVVGVGAGLFTSWQDIGVHLIQNQGVGDEGAALLGFVAGYTLPLFVGFFILAFLAIKESDFSRYGWPVLVLALAFILWVCGEAARALGLGLLPDYTYVALGEWPAQLRPLGYVLTAYFNSYGFGLMLCALALGVALAVQVERWVHDQL